MSPLPSNPSTEVVQLSYWSFTAWWGIILAVHVVTCVYNALYAYCYWELQHTYLNMYLYSLDIGMPPPHHHTIAIVHAVMSSLHAVCIFLMLIGSTRQRSLAFTPWATCETDANVEKATADRTNSVALQIVTKLYTAVSDRHGLCGVNGNHFHAVLVCREVVETALQTVQAYRMSVLLPRTLLNRFYVVLLAVNCWSSVIVYSLFFKRDEARRRFTCIVLDCVLDLMACMGVELMVLLSYAKDYDPSILGFPQLLWYDDEWAARALNEFNMVVVVSWSDLVSRSIFSLGLIFATSSMKELLQCLPRKSVNHVTPSPIQVSPATGIDKNWTDKLETVSPKRSNPTALDTQHTKPNFPTKSTDSYGGTNLRSRSARLMLRSSHIFFGVWGLVVIGLHIQASVQPTLPQCLMQVRPWTVSRPSCYLVGLDCHTLDISGTKNEVHEKWSEFDSFTVVQLLVRHCPALEMPDVFSEFHQLRTVKLYNTTIDEWGESAALTSTNHPVMSSLLIVRVKMTDGLLPVGLHSTDFPSGVYDIEICATNLRDLPDDLDTKWPPSALIQIEYSQFTTVPPVLTRLQPYYLSVTGNPITELPAEVFEIEGLLYLGISEMNIDVLPRNVTQLSSTLSWIYLGETDVSFFWNWADELVKRMEDEAPPLLAGASTYCNELEQLQNGEIGEFSVPLSPEYSQSLMDSSDANRAGILAAVKCDTEERGLFYPIDAEDAINAISDPPLLVRPN